MASYEAFHRHVQKHGPHPVPPPPQHLEDLPIKQEPTIRPAPACTPPDILASATSASSSPPTSSRLKNFPFWHTAIVALVFTFLGYEYRRAIQPSPLCFPVDALLNASHQADSAHAMLKSKPDKIVNAFDYTTLPQVLEFRDASTASAHSIGDLTPQSFNLRDPTDARLLAKLPGIFTKLHNTRDLGKGVEMNLEKQCTAIQKSLKQSASMAQIAIQEGNVAANDAARYAAKYKDDKERLDFANQVLGVISSGTRLVENHISSFIAFDRCLREHEPEETDRNREHAEQRARHCFARVFGRSTRSCY